MAQRRMFSMKIIDTDQFLDMPQTAQLLYFHLAMRADDEGFVASPKKIMRGTGSSDDDLKILLAKKFLIGFETGIIVIRDWKIHNYIAKDRFTETHYKDEKNQLTLDENGSYTKCIQIVDNSETQVRLGKDRIGKDRKEKESKEKTSAEAALFNSIKNFFENHNPDYYHDGKQAAMIKKIEKRGKDWDTILSLLQKFVKTIQESKDNYWAACPITPANFYSRYDGIIAYKDVKKYDGPLRLVDKQE